MPLRFPAEIAAPFLGPCLALLGRPTGLQLAAHTVGPAAAGVAHDARQGGKGPPLLFGVGGTLGELLGVFDGGKAKPGRSDGRRPPQARAPLPAAVAAALPLLCSRTRPRLRHE